MRPTILSAIAALVTALVTLIGANTPAAATELLYVHDPSCSYCREWERVIGPIYPKSAEGRLAPLRPMLISKVPAAGFQLKTPVRYTPTFVLLDGGREIGRIEGYPGEELFWMRLEQLLDKMEPEPAPRLGTGATRIRFEAGR